jgi:hypothetical protein
VPLNAGIWQRGLPVQARHPIILLDQASNKRYEMLGQASKDGKIKGKILEF